MSKVSAMFFSALLRSGVMFSENVSSVQFQGSQVLELIAWAIQWLNFGSQRNLSLDRRDAFPQANDRTVLIWVDGQDMDTLRTESVRRPCVWMHTLRTFGVVGTWNSNG